MSMDNQDARQFRGVWIPADIWLSKELSLQEKVMLVEIESLQHPERGCFKTNKRLAEFFNLSASRVSEVISSLARKGFIRIVNIRDGKQIVERRIFLSTPFDKPDTPSESRSTPSEKAANPLRDSEDPPSEKAEERGSSLSNTQERVSGEAIAAGADAQVAAGNVVPSAPRARSKFDPLAAKPGSVSDEVWADWCQHRREIRKPLTATTCKQQERLLANHPNPDAVISLSIANGWTGLFPEKIAHGTGSSHRPASRPSAVDQVREAIAARAAADSEAASGAARQAVAEDDRDVRPPLDGEFRRVG